MRNWAVALLLLLCLPGILAADSRTILHRVHWEGSLLGRRVAGVACWLAPGDGAWRLEVSRGPDIPWPALLSRHGEGWCLLGGVDGTAYSSAWGRPLRPLTAAAAGRLRLLLQLAEGDPTGSDPRRTEDPVPVVAARFPPFWSLHLSHSTPDTHWLLHWGHSVADSVAAGAPSSLHERLVRRGRGRGGEGETWRLERLVSGGWKLTSTRLPGSLLLGPDRPVSVLYPADLIYLPDLPLADLLQAFPKPEAQETGRHGT